VLTPSPPRRLRPGVLKDRDRIGLHHYFDPTVPAAETAQEWADVLTAESFDASANRGSWGRHILNHPDDAAAWNRWEEKYQRKLQEHEESERQLQALVEHLDRDPAPLVFWLVE